jgi:hypothetical protein
MIQKDTKRLSNTQKTAAGSKRRVAGFKSFIFGFLLAVEEYWSWVFF